MGIAAKIKIIPGKHIEIPPMDANRLLDLMEED